MEKHRRAEGPAGGDSKGVTNKEPGTTLGKQPQRRTAATTTTTTSSNVRRFCISAVASDIGEEEEAEEEAEGDERKCRLTAG